MTSTTRLDLWLLVRFRLDQRPQPALNLLNRILMRTGSPSSRWQHLPVHGGMHVSELRTLEALAVLDHLFRD